MAHDSYPRGAGLGRDANRNSPGLVDFDWTMRHGGRAQRREIVRQLKTHKRQGHPDADATLADYQARFGARGHAWRITIPGRTPFIAFCMQGAPAAEMLERYPQAVGVELVDER